MHEIIEVKIIFPDDGLQINDITGRLIPDLKKLGALPPLGELLDQTIKIRRHIYARHKKGRSREYCIEDYFVAPNGTSFSFPDLKRNYTIEEIDKL